ncbi:hypothetical protein HDV00_001935 [Rhizophlyctis rosea]|nr:hypothetical protein HDV00_001935 [Rhizophlyctis rosea]
MNNYKNQANQEPPPVSQAPGQPAVQKPPSQFAPAWKFGMPTNLYVYMTEEPWIHDFGDKYMIWKEEGLKYGDWSDLRQKDFSFDVPERVQNNGSLYAHSFLCANGKSPDPRSELYSDSEILYTRKHLTRYMPKKKEVHLKKLVKGGNEKEEKEVQAETPEQSGPVPIVSYWWSNLTLNIIPSDSPLKANTPPLVMQHVRFSEDLQHYYPIFVANDFWMLNEDLMPINNTVKTLNLTLQYSPLAFWKFQLITNFEQSFKIQNDMMGVASSETDEIKRMFKDTNPILLGLTMIVSILHSVFDFLAFKNDIQFWRKKKSMEGLSFRTIVLNVFFQLVIFLYLMDNETSKMILVSNGIGLVIEVWKIQKAVIVKRKEAFPFVEFVDRYKPSKLVAKTQKYDEMAFKYLSYVMYPLLGGYAIYSVMYQEHKSWYSYIIGTLVGFVYAFGFITMTPQLFINYKLKSVAHMPWKTFMYKALNTFVDDLFAFVIKMPWLHRLACLRDDVIFFVYLYQRWIYPEDKKRRNEFGQVGEEGDDEESEEEEEEKEGGEKVKGGKKVEAEKKDKKETVKEPKKTK